ncbi:HNH endonuclease [Candidatus Saccharibacteria bacterium]|nr:HNH endonuclease [Candidatus Saccharibacteria bacterium]
MKPNTNGVDDYVLTQYDKENWWNFLVTEYPDNYTCACQYYSDQDPILAQEHVKPHNFFVNDYFRIYELPVITAADGIIKVNGTCVKRYSGFEEWKQKRLEFEELKKTPLFKKWKKEEFKCQHGRCAWCGRKISLYDSRTQIDHIVPLYYDGDNSLDNLVICCLDCNRFKGAKYRGFNSSMDNSKTNFKPQWIEHNRYTDDLYYSIPTERNVDTLGLIKVPF